MLIREYDISKETGQLETSVIRRPSPDVSGAQITAAPSRRTVTEPISLGLIEAESVVANGFRGLPRRLNQMWHSILLRWYENS